MSRPRALIPFHVDEGISVKEAAMAAGKSERTIRLWCEAHGIGRRVADGAWVISRPALLMLLEGDMTALQSYLDGARGRCEPVAYYFQRAALGHLLDLPDFAV
jgi:hypothetical protein